MPEAARPAQAEPMVKPQNISVTSDERRFSGQISAVRVMAAGMAPPRPMPVRNRSAISHSTEGENAEAKVITPKKIVVAISTGLRPMRSASGPKTKAPAIRPKRPAAKSGASSAGVTPHSARRLGAMKPIAAVSKPSIATTRKQRAITVFWKRDRGWAFTTSCTSRMRAGAGIGLSSGVGCLGQIAEGCRASGVTSISMKGKSGSVLRSACSSSWSATSKIETFEYCPAMRQICGHLPARWRPWERSFSSAFSASRRAGSMSCGGRTSIRTW
jgi:hypothetical protein